MDFAEIESSLELENKPIFEKSVKTGIQNMEIAEKSWKSAKLCAKMHENESPRKLENVESAKSVKFSPCEN